MLYVDDVVFDEHLGVIDATIKFKGCDVVYEVYRTFEDKQWYVYDLAFSNDGSRAGIDDIDMKYPVSQESDLQKVLEEAVAQDWADRSPV